MRENLEAVLQKVLSIGVAATLVATLSALAVVRADNRTDSNLTASGGQSGTFSGQGAEVLGEQITGGDQATTGAAAGGSAAAGSGGSAAAGGAAGPGARAGAAAGRKIVPSTGTDCPDYNPNQGVFCDKYLVGGTTVLSGPLAVYGDQGLKGGLAFLAWFNSTLAAREQIRQAKLIWYNDDLDPNKTLQYVQRLNEVDKVLYLAGITSPEATSKYLETAKFPLIGDIGLSPKSYVNPYIFATSPSEQLRNPLRVKLAKQRFNVKSFAVVQDVLPSVDTGPFKKAWEQGARDYGVELLDYKELASTASDCSGQFASVIQKKPEYLVLDARGRWVPEGGRGWRLEGGTPNAWLPAGAGRGQSRSIPVSLGITNGFVAVYGADGSRHLREGEVGAAVRAHHAEERVAGARAALRRLARRRFGVVAALEGRIDAADGPGLEAMLDRLLTAAGPDDL